MPDSISWELAAAPESTDHLKLDSQYGLFIDGEFVDSEGGEQFSSINPATEKPLAKLTEASTADVDRAVKAARVAYTKTWSKMPGRERGKYIFRIARLIQERARELAVLETLDGGKPIRESRDIDIPLAAAHFFYHAGWADKLNYAFPNRNPKPLGVVGQVIPWNFPLLMAAWKIAPALAAGNTVVLKPAETTSLTAMKLAEIFQQAELPPGVVNFVTGHGAVGETLVNHQGVDKVAFTGSTAIGKRIQKSLAGTNKRLTLELGGKAANIVFEDATIDQAVEGIVNGIYFNQGHVCCAGSRLLVQGIGTRRSHSKTQAPNEFADRRRSARQKHRCRCDQFCQTAKDNQLLHRNRQRRGSRIFSARIKPARARLLVSAKLVYEGRSVESNCSRRNFRAGFDRPNFPDGGRGHQESEQHSLRVERGRLDGQRIEDFQHDRSNESWCRVGEHV